MDDAERYREALVYLEQRFRHAAVNNPARRVPMGSFVPDMRLPDIPRPTNAFTVNQAADEPLTVIVGGQQVPPRVTLGIAPRTLPIFRLGGDLQLELTCHTWRARKMNSKENEND